jgi:TRAP transporter TAXI family solute receptor
MGRLALAGVALVTAAVLAACSPDDPPGGEGRLSIATGGSGGVYQVYGGALADLLTDELPDSPTTAETTSASVDNLLLVEQGDSDVAFTLADTAIDAVRGRPPFERPLKLRALAKIYLTYAHVVVPADSGIETIEDLKGKTLSVGAPNSGSEILGKRLLEVAGLDPDEDVSLTGLSVGESVAAMRDGTIDAFTWTGGVPTSAVTDLATTDEIRMVPLDRYLPEMRERFGEAYVEAEFEEGDYKGISKTPTIGIPNLLMVSEDMPDDLAHDITQALFENKDRMAEITPLAKTLDPEEARKSIEPVPLHPGAERFYDEGGGSGEKEGSAAVAPATQHASASAPARVTARDAQGHGVELPLPRDGTFALRYRHSLLHEPAEERFHADGRGFALVEVASPSRAVLDYYERGGQVRRERGGFVLRFDEPARFSSMALAATGVGRRTLLAGGRSAALYPGGGGVAHLRIGVEAA